MRRRGVAAAPGDLDEAIAAFRRVREEGATQEERDIGDERLYELLVRRIHVEGHRADLDEVIELHERDARRPNERPREASVEEALRLRAQITGSSVDAVLAHSMNWLRSQQQPAGRSRSLRKSLFNEPYSVLAARRRAHTHPDHEAPPHRR